MSVKLLGNYLLVEEIKHKPRKGPGGIIDTSKPTLSKGSVIEVGEGETNGDYIYPPDFKVGDVVQYYSTGNRDAIVYKKKSCVLIYADDVILKGKE